ncbi:hypothetical protein EV421DRAFT_2029201 [Armillaria borealis]|uniref:F-box domain-containing protein n=1 Tax=Armillaria borealis TaxID=47425 RepID=A0AA39N3N2_9AGAR|nr:hypothetical protein EV421DRAFT_2029201 [Armillaria borealis]
MSSVSKINQLPDELLALILATGLRDLSSDAHQPLLALICSVCRHWRDVAIGASELWTTIHISLEQHLPATQTFLERSKGRLIDLYITELYPVILAHKVAEITAPHISRARTLTMTLPDFDIYNVFLTAYRSISATSLSSLSIHVPDALWSSHGHSPLFASTDSLRYLDTEGDFLRDVPSRASLTSLELNKYYPTHADIQNLFDASPCLETLILHRFDRGGGSLDRANEDDGAPITITAPTTLKSLAVSLSRYHTHINSATSCDCVLGSLRSLNLEYLEVVGSSVLNIDIDLKVHFGQLDKLRTLRIQDCTVSSADEEFFLSLKELRRLELVDMSPKDMRHIADPLSSSFSFPRLSSVFLSMTGGYMDGLHWLLQLAERCVAAGCPRFALEVEKGRSGEIFKAIESCIQDGRVCIIESDCGGLIIDEEESDEWPEEEDEDEDRWGDGEEYPFDEWPDDDDRWGDEEGYSSDEWPEWQLEHELEEDGFLF